MLVGVARSSYPDAQMPVGFHFLAVFLRKMSRHRLSKRDQIAGVSYTFQLLESSLSTLSSLIPGMNPSTVTHQPRVEHVTSTIFTVILVFHKNFEGSAHGSHGLFHAFNCSIALRRSSWSDFYLVSTLGSECCPPLERDRRPLLPSLFVCLLLDLQPHRSSVSVRVLRICLPIPWPIPLRTCNPSLSQSLSAPCCHRRSRETCNPVELWSCPCVLSRTMSLVDGDFPFERARTQALHQLRNGT